MHTIRDLRQARGWTQFALALKVGVQPQAVYLWEQGQRIPRVIPMRRLGVVFGLCSDEIDLEPRNDAGPASRPPEIPLGAILVTGPGTTERGIRRGSKTPAAVDAELAPVQPAASVAGRSRELERKQKCG